jgi:hypothetical protein
MTLGEGMHRHNTFIQNVKIKITADSRLSGRERIKARVDDLQRSRVLFDEWSLSEEVTPVDDAASVSGIAQVH